MAAQGYDRKATRNLNSDFFRVDYAFDQHRPEVSTRWLDALFDQVVISDVFTNLPTVLAEQIIDLRRFDPEEPNLVLDQHLVVEILPAVEILTVDEIFRGVGKNQTAARRCFYQVFEGCPYAFFRDVLGDPLPDKKGLSFR